MTNELNTLPAAALLAIHNVLADKPCARFMTRQRGEVRTADLLHMRGVTLAEAAKMAGINTVQAPAEAPVVEAVAPKAKRERKASAKPAPRKAAPASAPDAPSSRVTLRMAAAAVLEAHRNGRDLDASMTALSVAMGTKTPKAEAGGMTKAQKTMIDLLTRKEGATGKELMEAVGWPSIAARSTCLKLANRFGYELTEKPKAEKRGISFYLTAKAA